MFSFHFSYLKSSWCFSCIKRLLHFSAKRSKVKKYRLQNARISPPPPEMIPFIQSRCRIRLGYIFEYSEEKSLRVHLVLSKVGGLVSLNSAEAASGDILGAFKKDPKPLRKMGIQPEKMGIISKPGKPPQKKGKTNH